MSQRETRWTPEPWPDCWDDGGAPDLEWQDNYGRARDCVNACASMRDPAREIAAMREALHLLQKLYDILPHPLAWKNEDMKVVREVEAALSGGAQ